MLTEQETIYRLNAAIAMELQVSIQYIYQHVYAKNNIFSMKVEKIAIAEMKHAESLARRIKELGGRPATVPSPVNIGYYDSDMVSIDINDEHSAIYVYEGLLEGGIDEKTAIVVRRILQEEKSHLKFFNDIRRKV